MCAPGKERRTELQKVYVLFSCVKEHKEKNTTNVSFRTLCEESHKCIVRDFFGQSPQQHLSSLRSIEMTR